MNYLGWIVVLSMHELCQSAPKGSCANFINTEFLDGHGTGLDDVTIHAEFLCELSWLDYCSVLRMKCVNLEMELSQWRLG